MSRLTRAMFDTTSAEDKTVLRDAVAELWMHEDAMETLDIETKTGDFLGYVVRLLDGREIEVKLRTENETFDRVPR